MAAAMTVFKSLGFDISVYRQRLLEVLPRIHAVRTNIECQCPYVCMYVCMYVCIFIYTSLYVYTLKYTLIYTLGPIFILLYIF